MAGPGSRRYEWDSFDRGANGDFARGVLEDVSHLFGGRVVEVDEGLELRGRYEGRPVRFGVQLTFGSFANIEMKLDRGVEFNLLRDPESAPKPIPDPDDRWSSSGDDEFRLYFGPHIFLKHSKGMLFGVDDGEIRRWVEAPKRVWRLALDQLGALDASGMRSNADEACLSVNAGIHELDDPHAFFEDCASLLAACARRPEDSSLAGRFDPTGARGKVDGLAYGVCTHCNATYLFEHFAACPNCGNPRIEEPRTS